MPASPIDGGLNRRPGRPGRRWRLSDRPVIHRRAGKIPGDCVYAVYTVYAVYAVYAFYSVYSVYGIFYYRSSENGIFTPPSSRKQRKRVNVNTDRFVTHSLIVR